MVGRHISVQLKRPITIQHYDPREEPIHVATITHYENFPMGNRILVFNLNDIEMNTITGIPNTLKIQVWFTDPAFGEVRETGEIMITKDNIKAIVMTPQGEVDDREHGWSNEEANE